MLKICQRYQPVLNTALCAVTFGLLLASCASQAPSTQGPEQASQEAASIETKANGEAGEAQVGEAQEKGGSPDSPDSPFDETPQEIVYGHFSADVLSKLILAEMAGQRGMNQEALDNYLEAARETRDLGIIKRASRIATFMGKPEASTEMVQLWLQQEPNSTEAYQALALQMLAMKRYPEAMTQLKALQAMAHDADFMIVPARTASDDQAADIVPALIAEFVELNQRYPDNHSIRLGLAQLYDQNGQSEEALALVKEVAEILDYPIEVIVLEVQLLEDMGEPDAAVALLREGVERHSTSRQLRFMLGRRLVDQEDLDGARQQFNAIIADNPDDLEILYSLSLINLEVNRLNEAQRHLQVLAQKNFRPDDVHYYLGFINEQNNNIDAAINHYLKVSSGGNFLPAQRDLTELMIGADRYEEARQRLQRLRYTHPEYNLPLLGMESSVLLDKGYSAEANSLLNNALDDYPDNLQLLYLRSVLSTEQNNLSLMERDLRRIIELNPDSPVAYNTLGYVLADRTERYDEAYELIMTAYEMTPNDPAVIDSLGWVQYRLGMLEQARENLEVAFSLYPDHEVAAHLGEVLWVLGERRAANRIWQDALEQEPDSQPIQEAMQRLMTENAH